MLMKFLLVQLTQFRWKVLIYANLQPVVKMFLQISCISDFLEKFWVKRSDLPAVVYSTFLTFNIILWYICYVLYLMPHPFHFLFQYWYNWIRRQTFLQLHDCLCILHYLIAESFWVEVLELCLETFQFINKLFLT